MVWVWLAVAVLSFVLEAITLDLYSLWFGVGALVALILALCGVSPAVQIIVMLAVSVVALLSIRPFAVRFLKLKDSSATNADSMIGKEFRLLSDITPDTPGTVRVHGVIWSAVCEGKTIPAQTMVKVEKISGNKLIVLEEKIGKEEEVC